MHELLGWLWWNHMDQLSAAGVLAPALAVAYFFWGRRFQTFSSPLLPNVSLRTLIAFAAPCVIWTTVSYTVPLVYFPTMAWDLQLIFALILTGAVFFLISQRSFRYPTEHFVFCFRRDSINRASLHLSLPYMRRGQVSARRLRRNVLGEAAGALDLLRSLPSNVKVVVASPWFARGEHHILMHGIARLLAEKFPDADIRRVTIRLDWLAIGLMWLSKTGRDMVRAARGGPVESVGFEIGQRSSPSS